MAAEALLDTDVLSAVIRRRPQALNRAQVYLLEHGRFTFSVITRFESLLVGRPQSLSRVRDGGHSVERHQAAELIPTASARRPNNRPGTRPLNPPSHC